MFKDYPPGTALFQYFWLKLTGFKESSMITAYSIMILSMLMIGAHQITWKNWSRIIVYILLILPIPMIFYSNAYSAILIDPILGVTYAYGLASLFLAKRLDLFVSIRTGFALSFLIILKSTGLLSVVFILLYIIIKTLNNKNKKTNKNKLPYFILFSLPLIVQITWKIHLHVNKIAKTFKMEGISIGKVISTFTGNGPAYHKNVIISFIEAILNKPLTTNIISMTSWSYLILFILLSVIIIRFAPTIVEKKKFLLMLTSVYIYGFVYLISLLLMYLFVFNEKQGMMLVSFVRYMNVYNLSVLLLLMFVAFYYANGNQNKYDNRMGFVVVFMCVSLFFSQLGDALSTFIPRDEVANRKIISSNIQHVIKHTTVNDKICLILQNTSGKDYFIIKYSLFPRYSDSVSSFSIGMKYGPNDYYTTPITPDEWKNGLISRGFTHVYLYKVDDYFFEQYGVLFKDLEKIKKSKLFRVLPPENTFLLEVVE